MTYSYSLLILVALTLLANSAILPFSITPPCPTGKTAVDNGVPVTSNGCGSGPTQAKLAKNLIPFLTVLTPAAMTMTSVTGHVSHPTTWQYLMAVTTP